MANGLEDRLKKEYATYSEGERAAGREPESEWRWTDKKLRESEEAPAAPEKKPMTKRQAKQPPREPGSAGGAGPSSEYMKYRKERISRGRPYLSYDRWSKSRGQ